MDQLLGGSAAGEGSDLAAGDPGVGAQRTSDECDDDEGGVSAVFHVSVLSVLWVGGGAVGGIEGGFLVGIDGFG